MSTYWFISSPQKSGSTLALCAFFLAFFVILLGAYTRLTDAGLSCPDWPNCYGYITAPHTHAQIEAAQRSYPANPINVQKAWTEMTHRYFAGTEGFLILFLAIGLIKKGGDRKKTMIAVSLITLLALQVLLGMLTVTALLKPMIVVSHLMIGISLLSVLWWAYLDSKLPSQRSVRASPLLPWFWVAFFIVLGQIFLGGWVSTHYAGLACIDLPYCNGKLIPSMQWSNLNTDLITIHMLHRFGAMVTALYLSLFALVLMREERFRLAALTISGLIILQVTLGVVNILWLRPVWIALAHHGIAILIFIVIIANLMKAANFSVERYA